jgi:hypothetical protein
MAAIFLPLWFVFGLLWLVKGGGVYALWVFIESCAVGIYLVVMRIRAAGYLQIPSWYALTTSLGAGIFSAMILASAWKVLSGRGVTWRGRLYRN